MELRPRASVPLLLASGLWLALLAAADSVPSFSHRLHLDDAGAECGGCHVEASATQPLPVLADSACLECHDQVPAYRLASRARRLKIAFPHQSHSRSLQCVECHAAVVKDAAAAGAPLVARADCVACHDRSGITVPLRGCGACHGEDARAIAPLDHTQSWLLRHGSEARWRVHEEHGTQCQLCHGREACVACHRERKPRDHTALWRVRMHGSAASWDRDRCKTCHETGSCVRCHRSTTPVSHRGAWRTRHGQAVGGLDDNCTICHQPGWCASCHSGGR